MANRRISQLPAVATPASTDEFVVNQAGTSKKLTLAQVRTGPLIDRGGAVYNVKAFGAVGDGVADDTAAIQATIAEAIDAAELGARVVIPPTSDGYVVGDTLHVGDVRGLTIEGGGMQSRLLWRGGSASHVWQVRGQECKFQDFVVESSPANPANYAFLVDNGGGALNPSRNEWHRVIVEGAGAGGINGGWFYSPDGPGGDANTDFGRWFNCSIYNFSQYGFRIEGLNAHAHTMFNCYAAAATAGQHAVFCKQGFFAWYNGFVSHCSAATYFIESGQHPITIVNFNDEGSDRLLETSIAATPYPVNLIGGRFAGNELNADGDVIILNHPGALVLKGCELGGGAAIPTTIKLNYVGDAPGAHAEIVGNSFRSNTAAQSIFSSVKVGDGNVDLLVRGNTFTDGTGASDGTGLIPDEDATPNVQGNHIFRTQNTVATTITDFLTGHFGQEIRVIFGDGNTTIDFTGTNLKGNGGADWSPSTNDHMTCVYDGTNWYCDVSNNTA